MLGILLPAITKVVSEVISRFFPEKMDEAEKKKLEWEIAQATMELDWKVLEKEIEDRVSARKLAGQEGQMGNAWTMMLAALHRPMWSIGCLAIFVWTLIAPALGFPQIELTDVHQTIIQTVLIFYFGGRTAEKITGKVMKK